MKSKTHDLWLRVEVDEGGRIKTICGVKGEEEYASAYGAQDYWTSFYAVVPYLSVLCQEDPFGSLVRGPS